MLEVGLVVVVFGLGVVGKLEGDESILGVDGVFLHILVDLLVLQILIDHIGLHCLLDVLDVDHFALLQFLFQCLLHLLKLINMPMIKPIDLKPLNSNFIFAASPF